MSSPTDCGPIRAHAALRTLRESVMVLEGDRDQTAPVTAKVRSRRDGGHPRESRGKPTRQRGSRRSSKASGSARAPDDPHLDDLTRAVASVYAALLGRRSERAWIVAPGPAGDSAGAVGELRRGVAPKQDEDPISGGGL